MTDDVLFSRRPRDLAITDVRFATRTPGILTDRRATATSSTTRAARAQCGTARFDLAGELSITTATVAKAAAAAGTRSS
jgi:hypothetical protein